MPRSGGRSRPRPGAEKAPSRAADRTEPIDWDREAIQADFRELIAAKLRFIIPATVFFIVYYFALLILVGFARPIMETPVFGVVNLAYLFALSQFFMAWIIAWLYLRRASRFDALAKRLHLKFSGRK